MGAAAFIGRVGGLAVALGVGTAIAPGRASRLTRTPIRHQNPPTRPVWITTPTGTDPGDRYNVR